MKRKLLQSLMLAVGVTAMQFAIAANITVNANITANTTWTNNNTYILLSEILVKGGATLTIEPGTIIKGQYNTASRLVITSGSKIVAQGTPAQPIVFTSSQPAGQRKRGDWSGILILGNAPINVKDGSGNPKRNPAECADPNNAADYEYGGNVADDSSGVLSYVRIEYAGYVCGSNTELNSLTMGGVGSRTKIDHVQVSYGQDDGFEFFGGTTNVNHVISFALRDDDFDTDFGWSGKAQHGLIVRIDTIADQGDVSNAFESDNDASGTGNLPFTKGVISNFTIVGPAATTTSTIDAKYGWGARIRRNSEQSIFNSIFIGYKKGLFIDGDSSKANAIAGDLAFRNNIIAGSVERAFEASFDSAYIANPTNAITVYGGNANDSVKLVRPYSASGDYDFTLAPASPALTGADFTNGKLAGLATTAYRGAFGTDNWAACWSEFTPNDEVYTASPVNYGVTLNALQTGNLPSVTLNAGTGAGTYTYNWSTGGTAQTITVTNAGTYTVTVTSARGCTATATLTVVQTGVEDVKSNINSLSLFPNPTQNNATLELSLAEAADVIVTVTDVTGKIMMNRAAQLNSGINFTTINTTDYASGIYLVNIKNGVESKTVRLVVSK